MQKMADPKVAWNPLKRCWTPLISEYCTSLSIPYFSEIVVQLVTEGVF